MKLKTLIKNFENLKVKGSVGIDITGISSHSKLVSPGTLFIARKGYREDGVQFISEAIAAGAVACVTDMYNPFFEGVTQIIHPNPHEIEYLLAAAFYNNPSHELFTVGITGTNGKSTTAFLIKHLLDSAKMETGLIGTVEWVVGRKRFPATLTTPDVHTCQKLLREMVSESCKCAVMEVSSHALDQGRTKGIDFDVAVFTNITHEHLDYHKTFENYTYTKGKLFRELGSSSKKKGYFAVVNFDDPNTVKVTHGCKTPIITYGLNMGADLRAENLDLLIDGTRFDVIYKGEKVHVKTPFIGTFNISNTLAAMGVAIARGIPLKQSAAAMANAPQVPGRMEKIENKLGIHIFVDYAHTPDALTNVLEAVRTLKGTDNRKILLVFGCGGMRDREKRPMMGQVGSRLADQLIVTSDNPRNEEPEDIINEILAGIPKETSVLVEIDRQEAISKAIGMARPGDTVLIAGKGHETTQLIRGKILLFDDRAVTRSILANLKATATH